MGGSRRRAPALSRPRGCFQPREPRPQAPPAAEEGPGHRARRGGQRADPVRPVLGPGRPVLQDLALRKRGHLSRRKPGRPRLGQAGPAVPGVRRVAGKQPRLPPVWRAGDPRPARPRSLPPLQEHEAARGQRTDGESHRRPLASDREPVAARLPGQACTERSLAVPVELGDSCRGASGCRTG